MSKSTKRGRPAAKRGRGRPPGAKNKNTSTRAKATSNRGRGRPPGAKNKLKVDHQVVHTPEGDFDVQVKITPLRKAS